MKLVLDGLRVGRDVPGCERMAETLAPQVLRVGKPASEDISTGSRELGVASKSEVVTLGRKGPSSRELEPELGCNVD